MTGAVQVFTMALRPGHFAPHHTFRTTDSLGFPGSQGTFTVSVPMAYASKRMTRLRQQGWPTGSGSSAREPSIGQSAPPLACQEPAERLLGRNGRLAAPRGGFGPRCATSFVQPPETARSRRKFRSLQEVRDSERLKETTAEADVGNTHARRQGAIQLSWPEMSARNGGSTQEAEGKTCGVAFGINGASLIQRYS
jgi:hypothetical protein